MNNVTGEHACKQGGKSKPALTTAGNTTTLKRTVVCQELKNISGEAGRGEKHNVTCDLLIM